MLEQSQVLKSEPIHPVAGNADCRQPWVGDQKKIVEIKIYVIFFFFRLGTHADSRTGPI